MNINLNLNNLDNKLNSDIKEIKNLNNEYTKIFKNKEKLVKKKYKERKILNEKTKDIKYRNVNKRVDSNLDGKKNIFNETHLYLNKLKNQNWKKIDIESKECTFKPNINKKSKLLKRNISDLYQNSLSNNDISKLYFNHQLIKSTSQQQNISSKNNVASKYLNKSINHSLRLWEDNKKLKNKYKILNNIDYKPLKKPKLNKKINNSLTFLNNSFNDRLKHYEAKKYYNLEKIKKNI